MILYLHLLQYQISFIIVIIMFLHVKIKKVKLSRTCQLCEITLFICFICFSYYIIFIFAGGRVGVRGRIVVGFSLPMQSVLITSEVVRSNPTHGEVYLIQHYVIKFVSDLRQVCGFLRYSGYHRQ